MAGLSPTTWATVLSSTSAGRSPSTTARYARSEWHWNSSTASTMPDTPFVPGQQHTSTFASVCTRGSSWSVRWARDGDASSTTWSVRPRTSLLGSRVSPLRAPSPSAPTRTHSCGTVSTQHRLVRSGSRALLVRSTRFALKESSTIRRALPSGGLAARSWAAQARLLGSWRRSTERLRRATVSWSVSPASRASASHACSKPFSIPSATTPSSFERNVTRTSPVRRSIRSSTLSGETLSVETVSGEQVLLGRNTETLHSSIESNRSTPTMTNENRCCQASWTVCSQPRTALRSCWPSKTCTGRTRRRWTSSAV